MEIAIIGGGITGLTAGYTLTKQGHRVTIFERDSVLGGLAHGFKEKKWNWSLEKAYHHLFTNDDAIISLIKELDLEDKLIIKRPISANYVHGKIFPFDSPLDLLRYPYLNPISKLRTAMLVAFLKVNPDWIGVNPLWKPLESITAKKLFTTIGGVQSWTNLWGPLMEGKFGSLTDTVAASWLWARIKKRTPSLCYIESGFQTLIDRLADVIREHGGIIKTNTSVESIKKVSSDKYQVSWKNDKKVFDKILLTVPTPIACTLVPDLTFGIGHLALKIPHLHAQTLILETDEPILEDVYPARRSRCGAYWLNILDRSFPFLAVVAHTNFMDKKHYGNRHLTYFGNYLPDGHPFLSMTKEQLLKKFLPFIKRLNPLFRQLSIVNCQLFTGWYAQPVHQLHYSRLAPPMKTQFKGIYLANLDSIYPWDRGTNYAVELGEKAARCIHTSHA